MAKGFLIRVRGGFRRKRRAVSSFRRAVPSLGKRAIDSNLSYLCNVSLIWLGDSYDFPAPEESPADGLIAVGGDLHPKRILAAYKRGIFPWFSGGEPPLWWSPDPRMILLPKDLKVSKSMRQVLRKGYFSVQFDNRFDEVIAACASTPRKNEEGTWITADIKHAYGELHRMGYAHSVEVYNPENQLVGGLYGIAIGSAFFGESMFTRESNASKVGFIRLVDRLKTQGYTLIDCQVETDHLSSLGASTVSRSTFLSMLNAALKQQTNAPKKWELGA